MYVRHDARGCRGRRHRGARGGGCARPSPPRSRPARAGRAVPRDGLRLGTTCLGVAEDGAVFLDGEASERGDVVVGADGIHSAVRASLFGDEPLRYGGHRAWRAGTRFELAPRFVEVWGVGGGFGFGPAGDGRAYWYCFESVAEGAPAPERPKEEFLRRYGSWFDPIPALIESTDEAAIEPTFTY